MMSCNNNQDHTYLQRRVQEQRTLEPYVNELFHALFATTATGSLSNGHPITLAETDDEASLVVQIRKMETIAYAIVPSMKGGYTALEPYYNHMMNTFLSFAAVSLDASKVHFTSSVVQRRAATSIEVMTMIGQTLCTNIENDNNDTDETKPTEMVKQQFTTVAQQLLQWMVPVLMSHEPTTTSTTTTTGLSMLHRQLVSSCIRISTIYSNDIVHIYSPYLQYIIPYIVGQITDPAMDIELSVRVPEMCVFH